MRLIYSILLSLSLGFVFGQNPGPYAPAAGQAGSTAIHKDSLIISGWADSVSVWRGYLDIANKALGKASFGDSLAILGPANGNVLSLGDSGHATYVLDQPLVDASGPEFAIFENSFSDTYLELAFVEVSQDGLNFHRFPAQSLTDTSVQTGSFGATDPTQIYNLAGKYRADFGVPFDLSEISIIDSVYFIRIIDVVGSIDPLNASRDSQGRMVNDPYPTDFVSGGFDLDALAILSPSALSIAELEVGFEPYPNPAKSWINCGNCSEISIYTLAGVKVLEGQESKLNIQSLKPGAYLLEGVFNNQTLGRTLIQKVD